MTTTELREAHDQLFSDLEAARCEIKRLRALLEVRESEIDNLQARLDIYCNSAPIHYDSVPLHPVGIKTVRFDNA